MDNIIKTDFQRSSKTKVFDFPVFREWMGDDDCDGTIVVFTDEVNFIALHCPQSSTWRTFKNYIGNFNHHCWKPVTGKIVIDLI